MGVVRTVLLAPHHDDETLFAAFHALEYKPDLVVCTRSEVQQDRGLPITHADREAETRAAWAFLSDGTQKMIQWPFSDNEARTDWARLRACIHDIHGPYTHCIAPAVEVGGHAHHNAVGVAAVEAFGLRGTTRYLTYTRDGGRSTHGYEVEIKHPDWIIAKLRALACYATQIREPSTRPWFLGPLTEYRA